VKKTQNHKQKIKREKKQTHQEMFTQFSPTMTYSGGEIDLSNPLSMSSLQRDTKGLQEISSKLAKNKEQTLIFTIFPISPMNKTLNDFHSPKVFKNVSQPKRKSQEKPHQSPLTLKLPHLISQVSLS